MIEKNLFKKIFTFTKIHLNKKNKNGIKKVRKRQRSAHANIPQKILEHYFLAFH